MNNIIHIIFIIAAVIYVLFLPGFSLSLVFFRSREIDIIERFTLSLALSLTIVPLVAFYSNLLGIKISTTSVLIEVMGIIIMADIVYLAQMKFAKNKLQNHSRSIQSTNISESRIRADNEH